MATVHVTINDEIERIYKIEEVEYLIKEIQSLQDKLTRVEKVCSDMKTERRILYGDVKKIHGIIPMENGSVNLMRLPRIINEVTNNPGAIDGFKGIAAFVESYEKNNLIPIKK